MAEESKITLNVSSKELSDRIDAIPTIEQNIADILRDLPDTIKAGVLKRMFDTVEKCQTTVGTYQTLIKNANATSKQNKTTITSLNNKLSDTNDQILALRKQIFGSDPIGPETIVARINGKVDNNTYSTFITETENNFSGINKQINVLETKDDELQDGIKNNGTQIESIKKTLNGDKGNNGIISKVEDFESRLTTVESYQIQLDTIIGKVNTLRTQVKELQDKLGHLYELTGHEPPKFTPTEDTYSMKSGRN